MKILVLGASGFIGFPVCRALVRLGHIVYGQTRSRAKAQSLTTEEIVPVVCDPYDEAGRQVWGPVAQQVDVFIDVLSAPDHDGALATLKHYRTLIADRPKAAPRPTYIYTGGLWSHTRGGDGLSSWTDERQPRSHYLKAVQWRAVVEDPLLLDESLNGIVIRPGIVHGYSASFVGTQVFEAAYKASKSADKIFSTLGQKDTRWSTIHVDDVADLYARVAERGNICRGQTFLAINTATERQSDVLDVVARVSGCKGWTLVEPTDGYDIAWCSTLNARPSLGRALVGWEPRRPSLADGMDIYWAAWLASRGDSPESSAA